MGSRQRMARGRRRWVRCPYIRPGYQQVDGSWPATRTSDIVAQPVPGPSLPPGLSSSRVITWIVTPARPCTLASARPPGSPTPASPASGPAGATRAGSGGDRRSPGRAESTRAGGPRGAEPGQSVSPTAVQRVRGALWHTTRLMTGIFTSEHLRIHLTSRAGAWARRNCYSFRGDGASRRDNP